MPNDDRTVVAFELDGDVRDAEVRLKTLVNFAKDVGRFAEAAIFEQHVRGKRVRSAADRPHVKVVHAETPPIFSK